MRKEKYEGKEIAFAILALFFCKNDRETAKTKYVA